MKNFLFLMLPFLILATDVNGQEDIKKDLGAAKRALAAFTLDQANNKPKLGEAKEAIDRVMATSTGQSTGAAWQLKGEIYNEIASQIIQVRQLGFGNLEDLPNAENPSADAYSAFVKAHELALKGVEKKDALKFLQLCQSNLSNLGIYAYEAQNYAAAYTCFNAVLGAHELLSKNSEASSLDVEADYLNQIYITGLAAMNAGKKAEAKALFGKLFEIKYDKGVVYEALYQLYAEEDIEKAYSFLAEGRKLFPQDVSILFGLINHNLKTGKLDLLLTDLKEAIAKEPDNITLYSVMGNVYDQLYQKMLEANEKAKATEYFDQALTYYNDAIKKDPNFVDAIYSVGALYYNRAALLTKEMNALQDDYSKEGMKKYEDLKAKIYAEFNLALPYFQRAEAINPNDVNTLIALKEIYARENQLELSQEFKKRLETVQDGGKNAAPYFKN
ncbi:MAG: hypothetical protein ACOYOO_13825 [Saprospiraceae bacterium]